MDNDLLSNLNKIHTTELGAERIRKNMGLDTSDVVAWCKSKIEEADIHSIIRKGKNWYVQLDNAVITINAHSFTIITAHKGKLKQRDNITHDFTKEDLKEALRAIESTISKCEKVQPKLQQGTSQHTLLIRRIETVFWMNNSEGARISPWEFLSEFNATDFFLNSRSLFVLGDDAIRRVDFATRGITRLPVPISSGNIAFDGRSIYYQDEDSRLFAYDTETGEAAAFSDIAAKDFFLTEDRIYYLDRRDRDTLHAYELADGTAQKLADIPANSVWIEGESICFWARDEGTGYLINPDGTGLRPAGEMP